MDRLIQQRQVLRAEMEKAGRAENAGAAGVTGAMTDEQRQELAKLVEELAEQLKNQRLQGSLEGDFQDGGKAGSPSDKIREEASVSCPGSWLIAGNRCPGKGFEGQKPA